MTSSVRDPTIRTLLLLEILKRLILSIWSHSRIDRIPEDRKENHQWNGFPLIWKGNCVPVPHQFYLDTDTRSSSTWRRDQLFIEKTIGITTGNRGWLANICMWRPLTHDGKNRLYWIHCNCVLCCFFLDRNDAITRQEMHIHAADSEKKIGKGGVSSTHSTRTAFAFVIYCSLDRLTRHKWAKHYSALSRWFYMEFQRNFTSNVKQAWKPFDGYAKQPLQGRVAVA